MDWVYGYKLHLLACVEQTLPIAFYVTPANQNDSPTLTVLLRKAKLLFRDLRPTALMADRGYDSRDNCEDLHKEHIAPVIPRRQFEIKDDVKPVYSYKGMPFCIGGEPMEYVGTDSETGRHGFRCPVEGCYRKQEPFKGYTVCDDVVWEDPDENVYEVGGRISRANPEWWSLYGKRWEVERYFSMLKSNHWVEDHRVRGLAKVDLHITMAVLMFQAAALDRMAGSGIQPAFPGLH